MKYLKWLVWALLLFVLYCLVVVFAPFAMLGGLPVPGFARTAIGKVRTKLGV